MNPSRPASPHFDDAGNPHLVDVSQKGVTHRTATAVAQVSMLPATAELIRSGGAKKGDVLAIARLAAIQASKQTPFLIPLCHAIPIEAVEVEFRWRSPSDASPPEILGSDSISPRAGEAASVLECLVKVSTHAKTGVEMEAMTAVSVACVTVYDMVKAVDRGLTIGPILLLEKTGGKSGHFQRPLG